MYGATQNRRKPLSYLLLAAVFALMLSVVHRMASVVLPLPSLMEVVLLGFGTAALFCYGMACYRLGIHAAARAAANERDQTRRIVPICSDCKRVRDNGGDARDQGSWDTLEHFMDRETGVRLSHGLCPECLDKHMPHGD